MEYNFNEIEEKWAKYWEDNNTFKTNVYDFSKPKYYALDMFPYPSGQGLHIGHPEGYTATDIIARMKRMQGYNVLHPMGFDSFGLPAEQYAIKTGNHPDGFTQANIKNFKSQLRMLGFSYDWSRQISTCDPSYYKWTQYIFIQLYNAGLVKYEKTYVNWCEELGTVLSNDEVIDGKSERGGFPVVKREMYQWVMDIPKYAEDLLQGLDTIDWPESTKSMQKYWIGKSTGAIINFKVNETNYNFDVFTTRPDTLFGATYCVLSPEHELVDKITTKEYSSVVKKYKEECAKKSDLERTELNKEKTGAFTGAYAVNPVNNELLPIYIADYVLVSYATGSIMAVPAHDDRDYDFAKKFGLKIIQVLEGGDVSTCAYTGDGVHINSGFLDGLNKEDAIKKIIDWLEENKIGYKKVNYKMREWIFARQRYWGEPIPVVHMEDGTIKVLDTKDLPLVLPEMKDYSSRDGKAPLENATDWKNVIIDGKKGVRETSTMPGSAGSSWYFLRYIDPNNENEIADKKLLEHWMPVDFYMGGAEHTVGHLLYSRFWNMFLHSIGISPVKEPFKKLCHQGMILGENGEKMSKSRGNVVNPNDLVAQYGADTLRLYQMFMGPIQDSKPWNTSNIEGAKRFLDRVFRLFTSEKVKEEENKSLEKIYHQTVKKVTSDMEALAFNTAISSLMILLNEMQKEEVLPKEYVLGFIKMLNPICPFITEELWQILGHKETITYEEWPKFDESKTIDNEIEIVVQVNSKIVSRVIVPNNATQEQVESIVKSIQKVTDLLNGKQIVKTIFVPNKLINFIAK